MNNENYDRLKESAEKYELRKQLLNILSSVTKEKKEVYDEIWNTIASKNTNILLGYTKENAETAKTMKEN